MKKISYSFVLFLAFIFCFSCQPPEADKAVVQAEERAALKKEAMRIHDDVMPKINDIENLIEELDSIDISLVSKGSTKNIAKINEGINSLNIAHNAMFQWMDAWATAPKEENHEAYMQFLGTQKQEIVKVQDYMLQSIEKGEAIAKQYRE